MKYTESQLSNWTSPISQTEEDMVQNTINMIRDAIDRDQSLSSLEIEIFAQGSYANNTNVRQNSDVDVCVMLKSSFFTKYADNKSQSDYGFSDGDLKYEDYKKMIADAIISKFGLESVAIGNKCININSNSYHVNADVVPAMQYRNYWIQQSTDPNTFIEGIKFRNLTGNEIVNYPKDHINNGINKNNVTSKRYKRFIRIIKHIRNDMIDDGVCNKDIITSFLLECLAYNVPDSFYNKNNSWLNLLNDVLKYLYSSLSCHSVNDWVEVSERFYLFNSSRKWNVAEVTKFILDMIRYLEC